MINQADTDQAGVFQFTGLQPGNYEINVDVPGYTPVQLPVQLSIKPLTGLIITLSPVASPAPHAGGSLVDHDTTDAVGHFLFTGLVSGHYEIVIHLYGFQTVRLPVPLGGASANALIITLTPVAASSPSAGGPPTVSVWELEIPAKARKQLEEGKRSFDAGKMADAASHLEKAIEIYPGYNRSYMVLAAARADQGQFALGDAAIQKSLSPDPQAHSYSDYVLIQEENFAGAEQAFQQSIALLDTNWFARLEYGRLLAHEKRFAGAYPQLALAHQHLPELRLVHRLLYNTLIALNRKQEGLAELDDLLSRFPDDPRAAQVRQMRRNLAASLAQQTH